MTQETPKDAQKGGQGAIGKQPRPAEQQSSAPQEKKTHYDKDQRPGQKP